MFDTNGSGNTEQLGWIAQGTGLLVYDPNGAATLTSGTQLFGNSTLLPDGKYALDGFQALAALDKSGSGHIDASNPEFANLRIWVGAPGNGSSNSALATGKMMTLKELGIVDISLHATKTWANTGGAEHMANTESSYAVVTWADGHTTTMGDINFAADPFYQHLKPIGPLSDAVKVLPEMAGCGPVYDTQQAAQKSPAFADMLKKYSALTSRADQVSMLPQLLKAWADSSDFKGLMARNDWDIASNNYVYVFDSTKMFAGQNPSNPLSLLAGGGIPLQDRDQWSDVYKQMADMVGVLEVFNGQALYEPSQTDLMWGRHADAIHVALISGGGGSGDGGGKAGIKLGATYKIEVNAQQVANLQQSYQALEQSVYEGLLMQTRIKPYLDAIKLNINPKTGAQFDLSGLDKILDNKYAANPIDATLDLLELTAYGRDMLVATGWDMATKLGHWISDLTANGSWQKISAQLQDGLDSLIHIDKDGKFSLTDAQGNAIYIAKSGDDTLQGGSGHNILYGGSGNTIMYGAGTSNTFYGGTGHDTMLSQGGCATYIGGSGFDVMGSNDCRSATTTGHTTDDKGNLIGSTYIAGTGGGIMYGSDANNLYQLSLGCGSDSIFSAGYSWYGDNGMANRNVNNVLKFGPGISAGNIWAETSGIDLILHYSDKDAVTLKEWFVISVQPVQTVQFADGSSMNIKDLLNSLSFSAGHAANGVIYGVGKQENLMAGDGNVSVMGGNGDATLTGGSGNDSLYGGTGSNTFHGGSGNTIMYGAGASNTFYGGTGHDTMLSQGGSATYIGGSGFDVMGSDDCRSVTTTGHTTDVKGNPIGSTYIAGTGGGIMYGSDANNLYQLSLGCGSDSIFSAGYSWYGVNGIANRNVNNVLKFGAGISADKMWVENRGIDLILHYSDKDAVTLAEWAVISVRPVQTVQFADGSSMSIDTLLSKLPVQINGTNGVFTGVGANELMKSDSQNDTMTGGAGNVSYEISSNATHVTINNAASGAGHASSVLFDSASSNQLWFQHSGNDLLVSEIGTTTQIDISGWYAGDANHVQQFRASDGKVLLDKQVDALVSAMAGFAPPAAGAALPQNAQDALQPALAANWH
ncbi:hypothetical protein C2I19_11050 [Chromobacterium alticapitis]|uniref:Haemolysin-type calcium binding-related domain-containing protein n=2 Tax=Chromobacterium alticapitis TaxID=2073169 RepID=A0A2S5DG19_9NEIS|nr:hypothetical protein C2I19_11050 [Chromobacterium alticapitis]